MCSNRFIIVSLFYLIFFLSSPGFLEFISLSYVFKKTGFAFEFINGISFFRNVSSLFSLGSSLAMDEEIKMTFFHRKYIQ